MSVKYEDAAQAAYSSMLQSNELGQLISFFTKTAKLNDCDELFVAIEQFVKQFAAGCAVEFRLSQSTVQFPQQHLSTLESEILELGRSAKSVVPFGPNLLLNSKWCSLLVKKLPFDDEELCGRLRDNCSILLGIIESRLMLLDSQQNRVKERRKVVGQLSGALDTGLEKIKSELQKQECQIQDNIHELESSLSISLVSLGLSEEQESALMGIVEDTRERFDYMVGSSINIDNEMRKFDRLLGKIN
jgi:hypothetical protein